MKKFKIMIACLVIVGAYLSFNAFIVNPHGSSVPSVPVLDTPGNGATGISLTPVLQVINSTGGTGARLYDFQLTLASDVNFNNPIIRVSNLSEGGSGKTSYTVPSSLMNNTSYIWKAECHTVADGSSGYSGAFGFLTTP